VTSIRGAVAVVTGGASGIGRGIAEEFIERGARVVIADINAERLAQTASEIGAFPVPTDVTSSASVASLREATHQEFGRVDIVVNNAGVGPIGYIEDLTLADWRWMLDVNLWGVIHGIDAFLPDLIANERGGHIVNTVSFAVFNPLPGLGAYSAGKFAVQALSETLAIELAERHPLVRVSILPPGPVRSNIRESLNYRPAGETGGLQSVDMGEGDGADEIRWIDGRTAGRVVARAIEHDDLYAITHPEWWPLVDARVQRIREEFDRYPEPLL
jgi:NAD(P)-dependent dehydrogenase (short-subunit alcohol dehydrogenase family)